MQSPEWLSSFPSEHKRSGFKKLCWFLLGLVLVGNAFAQLPPGWANQDVGSPTLGGSASWANGEWTMTGGGAEICGTNSQFHFAWTPFNGDGSVIARVSGFAQGGFFSEAGLMIRSDLSPGAAQATLMVRTNTSIWFRTRSNAEGGCTPQAASPRGEFLWLKIERSGNTFAAYYSPDRQTWTQIGGAQTLMIGARALAGLVVCSYSTSAGCTARFSEVFF
jgi:regulation of enolase protein 1 (concanavalin A-like superfamily)